MDENTSGDIDDFTSDAMDAMADKSEKNREDYDLWLRLKSLNKKFYNCPEILVKHRIHEASAFNSKGNKDKVRPLLLSHGYKCI